MAHRVVNDSGESAPARRSTNSRLAKPLMVAPTAPACTPPAAPLMPSSRRALSRSVCRRPTIHVPALERAL
jgi:hypothetical protein